MKNKFRAKKTWYNGQKYDSKKEAKRASELEQLEKAGIIFELKKQVRIQLIPTQRLHGKTYRGVVYIADFSYTNNDGEKIIEDSKGFKTKDYIIKKKLLIQKIINDPELQGTKFIET